MVLLLYHLSILDFKKAIHFVQDKIIQQNPEGHNHSFTISSQHNALNHMQVSIISPNTSIPTSFTMIKINHSLETHEKYLHFSADSLRRTCTSNDILHMSFMPRYCCDCYIYWFVKWTHSSQLLGNKSEKWGENTTFSLCSYAKCEATHSKAKQKNIKRCCCRQWIKIFKLCWIYQESKD